MRSLQGPDKKYRVAEARRRAAASNAKLDAVEESLKIARHMDQDVECPDCGADHEIGTVFMGCMRKPKYDARRAEWVSDLKKGISRIGPM